MENCSKCSDPAIRSLFIKESQEESFCFPHACEAVKQGYRASGFTGTAPHFGKYPEAETKESYSCTKCQRSIKSAENATGFCGPCQDTIETLWRQNKEIDKLIETETSNEVQRVS